MKKKYKKAKVIKKKTGYKLAFWALFLLAGIIVIGKLFVFLASLNEPISNAFGNKGYRWDLQSPANLVYLYSGLPKTSSLEKGSDQALQVAVISYHPKDKKIMIMHISDQTLVNVPKGYGQWRIGSVYKLGQEEPKPVGGQLLKLAVSNLLGLPIDGIIISKKTNSTTPESLITGWHQNNLASLFFVNSVKTDLTLLEASQIFWQMAKVRSDKVSSLDFAQSSITESKLLPDSTRVLGIDSVKLDLFIRDKMYDENIIAEGLSVAVYNATKHPGLTQDVARTITNMGGNVVMTDTLDKVLGGSIVTYSKDVLVNVSQKLTLKRLQQIYAPRCLKTNCSSNNPVLPQSRAQISILLGEDFYNLWYKR